MNSSSEWSTKKSWRTGKTSGWAAFDLEQRRKLSLEPNSNNEPFPPISSSVMESSVNVPLMEKPFASVVHNPLNLLTSANAAVLDNTEFTGSRFTETIKTNNIVNESGRVRSDLKAHEMLTECYPWADGGLIEDVLAGVNNDVEQASNILIGMLSTENNCVANDEAELEGQECMSQDFSLAQEDQSRESATTDLLEEGRNCSNDELSNDSAILKIIQTYLNSVPSEPEWEEDDVYWVHRKDALKMMRSAAHHSKAANDSYLKGNHLLAQQHSLKAREEWTTANKLNDMAAKEICRIRNAKNDQWTLDLHGLHALEAVRALEEHLRKIESAVPVDRLKSTNTVREKSGAVVSAPHVSMSCSDLAKMYGHSLSSLPSSSSRPKRPPLQVITGKGNHSRGEAALPHVIRRFLSENGYQFDDTRPGVVNIRPKFRV